MKTQLVYFFSGGSELRRELEDGVRAHPPDGLDTDVLRLLGTQGSRGGIYDLGEGR